MRDYQDLSKRGRVGIKLVLQPQGENLAFIPKSNICSKKTPQRAIEWANKDVKVSEMAAHRDLRYSSSGCIIIASMPALGAL